jgi:hypothetical protein
MRLHTANTGAHIKTRIVIALRLLFISRCCEVEETTSVNMIFGLAGIGFSSYKGFIRARDGFSDG